LTVEEMAKDQEKDLQSLDLGSLYPKAADATPTKDRVADEPESPLTEGLKKIGKVALAPIDLTGLVLRKTGSSARNLLAEFNGEAEQKRKEKAAAAAMALQKVQRGNSGRAEARAKKIEESIASAARVDAAESAVALAMERRSSISEVSGSKSIAFIFLLAPIVLALALLLGGFGSSAFAEGLTELLYGKEEPVVEVRKDIFNIFGLLKK